MRRAAAPLLLVLLIAVPFAGCLGGSSSSSEEAQAKKLQAARRPAAVFSGEYRFDGAYSQVLAEGPYKPLPVEHVLIKSKLDGVDIELGVWRPDVPADTKVPVIVHASPYHRGSTSVTRNAGLPLYLNDNFLPHGYAVAALAVRGTGNSGGCMDLMGKKENGDLDQAITWLGTQPWSNGKVAMIGGSYDGSTPWSVAAFGNPHLATIVPISGVPDIYHLMFRNGSSESRGPLLLNLLYYTYGFDPTDAVRTPNQTNPVPSANPYARTAPHRVEGLICPESWEGFVASLYSGATGERDPRGWWAERNRKPGVERNYHGSVLSIQGMQDWNVDPHMVIPWVDELNQTGVPTKQLLGQWGHAYPDRPTRNNPTIRWDWAEMLLHWFDYWLKDIRSVDTGPAVQVQDHTMKWRNEERYPPADARWQTLHLSGGQRLAPEPGAAGSVLLIPNPAGEALAPYARSVPGYSADFSLPPQEASLLVAGLPRLHITVTPHGPGGHLAAYLYDVDATGKEVAVGYTQINLRFADGTETPRPIMPNQPLLVKMQFEPLDINLQPGHALRLRVWEYQDHDRLPAIPPQPVTLNFGGSSKSTLELPIIERGPEAYFQPPMPPSR